LFEQKVYYELKHMQRMSPLKCQNAEKRRSTSIDEKNCMLLECNMSKKRAAEGLLQLASCKKAKQIKKGVLLFCVTVLTTSALSEGYPSSLH